jgi:plasmid stabilization system protein ParE
MRLPLFLLEAAERDIAHEIGYYNMKQAGLGDAFLLEVHATFARIQWKPELFRKVHPQLRRALVHRFPFAVGYRILDDSIEIVGIFPTQAHPNLLLSRIPPV